MNLSKTVRWFVVALLTLPFLFSCPNPIGTIEELYREPSTEETFNLRAISDGMHVDPDAPPGTQNPHFFFLPPMVEPPIYSGVFDGSLTPEVKIVQLTESGEFVDPPLVVFTMDAGRGSETVRVGEDHYIVNWHTKEFTLVDATTYRIQVLVADNLLGYADVDVVNSGQDLKNVDTDEYVALKDGRTLPIKFRIEEGAVGTLPLAPANLTVSGEASDSLDIGWDAVSGADGYDLERGPSIAGPWSAVGGYDGTSVGYTDIGLASETTYYYRVRAINTYGVGEYSAVVSGTTTSVIVSYTVSTISGNTTEAGGTATFTVVLDSQPTANVTVNYDTNDPSEGTVGTTSKVFTPANWNAPQTVTVTGQDDPVQDGDQPYTIIFTPSTSADLSYDGTTPTPNVEVTNIDNDSAAHPVISISDAEPELEGNSGTTDFYFQVSISGPYPLPVSVDFTTQDGSASSGNDYIATSGTLTFSPGELIQTVTVQVVGDTQYESNEYFFVDLSNPVNASVGDGTGYGTIENDDVQISISDAEPELEGNSGTTDFYFQVSISGPYPLPVSVDFTTQDGSASSGNDYIATSGTLTFSPGELIQTVTVQVVGDTTYESNEYFFVDLSNAVNASVGDGSALGTIENDD